MLVAFYYLVLAVLTLANFYKVALIFLYYRHRQTVRSAPRNEIGLPFVTIQIPLYNEKFVVERVIRAVAKMDYPKEKFEIQVLDDSTDETTKIARRVIDELKSEGVEISHLHRDNRQDYKAGALTAGLCSAKGELICIFDADFVPSPDFLQRSVSYFRDPKIGMVQAKWGFINEMENEMTRLQSIYLRAHFTLEHTARSGAGAFFNFNGTAGILRKAMIEEVGGWSGETLTEDLELSYRAHLSGWKFIYLDDLLAPSELPNEIAAVKSQQHRWVKGMGQVSRRMLPVLWKAKVPLLKKVDATFHLLAPVTYLATLLTSAIVLPALFFTDFQTGKGCLASLLVFNLVWTFVYFAISEKANGKITPRRVFDLFCLLPLGVALSINGTRAWVSGLLGGRSQFERTPKAGSLLNQDSRNRYLPAPSPTVVLEVLLALWYLALLFLLPTEKLSYHLPSLLLFGGGFVYLSSHALALCLRELWDK